MCPNSLLPSYVHIFVHQETQSAVDSTAWTRNMKGPCQAPTLRSEPRLNCRGDHLPPSPETPPRSVPTKPLWTASAEVALKGECFFERLGMVMVMVLVAPFIPYSDKGRSILCVRKRKMRDEGRGGAQGFKMFST